MKFVW